jgi:hypothetical protein
VAVPRRKKGISKELPGEVATVTRRIRERPLPQLSEPNPTRQLSIGISNPFGHACAGQQGNVVLSNSEQNASTVAGFKVSHQSMIKQATAPKSKTN